MLTGEIRSQIDQIWNAFWSGGIANPLEVIEQITYLLFLKRLDERETAEELKANREKRAGDMTVFPLSDSHLRAISSNCRLGLLLLVTTLTSACGSGGGSTNALAPTIVTQPANQKTTVGLTATFTVNAAR